MDSKMNFKMISKMNSTVKFKLTLFAKLEVKMSGQNERQNAHFAAKCPRQDFRQIVGVSEVG